MLRALVNMSHGGSESGSDTEGNISQDRTSGPFHGKGNQKNRQNEIFFERSLLSILLDATIGGKVIGPHGCLQVEKIGVTGSVD